MKNIEVIMCCIPRDLAIARLAVDGIRQYISSGTITVASHPDALSKCRMVLGDDVELVDERELTGGMSLEEIRKLHIEGFPGRAGWYLQQIAKLGYAMSGSPPGHYLIWDCDTIPLREMDLFDTDGRPFYTMSDEHHLPYWDTYERLFGFKPQYIGSFISQHMVLNKAVAREMLEKIEARHPSESVWSWAIMKNLAPSQSVSLFSEYETYGYYLATFHPNEFKLRSLPWTRDGASHARIPTPRDLKELSNRYYFAAFESWQAEEKNARTNKRSLQKSLAAVARRLRHVARL